MKCHALKGAAAGAAGGLAALALGVPVLAPIALIVGLVAGIRKDNEEVRRTRRQSVQEREDLDLNSDEDDEDAGSNRNRHIPIDSEITSILREFNERRRQSDYQRRIAAQDFNFTPFRTANEDEDTPRFINNNHEERRPKRDVDNTDEPSLRNEEYFRRHNRQ